MKFNFLLVLGYIICIGMAGCESTPTQPAVPTPPKTPLEQCLSSVKWDAVTCTLGVISMTPGEAKERQRLACNEQRGRNEDRCYARNK